MAWFFKFLFSFILNMDVQANNMATTQPGCSQTCLGTVVLLGFLPHAQEHAWNLELPLSQAVVLSAPGL